MSPFRKRYTSLNSNPPFYVSRRDCKVIANTCKSPGCEETFQVDEERIYHRRKIHPSMQESAEDSGEESENSAEAPESFEGAFENVTEPFEHFTEASENCTAPSEIFTETSENCTEAPKTPLVPKTPPRGWNLKIYRHVPRGRFENHASDRNGDVVRQWTLHLKEHPNTRVKLFRSEA